MLQDKDRIFTNLYSLHSPDLEAAKKRGAWHLTKEMLDLGPDWLCDQIKASGLRGRGGALRAAVLLPPCDDQPER